MKHWIRHGMMLLTLLATAAGPVMSPAKAADVERSMLLDSVTPKSPVRYIDLARQFVTDLAGSDDSFSGKTLGKIRHLGGPDYANAEADSFGIYDVSHLMMKADGKARLLVLFDFAQAADVTPGVAVLALYDLSDTRPRLLDAADIGFDASTSFFDKALLPIAEGSDLILTLSAHFNSSQSYATQSMILVRNDRFELVDSTTLLGERNCGIDRQQVIDYAANPGAAKPDEGKPYAPVRVTVTETTSAIEEVCADLTDTRLGTRKIAATYAWEAARDRYLPDSDALDRLGEENESRF